MAGGDFRINCGAFKLAWTPPAVVYFYEYQNKKGLYDTEMALTKWHAFEDIRLNEPLEWLKYDENRPYTRIDN